MKKVVLLMSALCLTASFAFAAYRVVKIPGDDIEKAVSVVVPVASEELVTLTGVIIDNLCAGMQKPEELAVFVKTHPKSCAVMPECAAAGYSIYADGKLSKFDKDSNAKIFEFLTKGGALDVVVVAKKDGDGISLVSIENEKLREAQE